MSATVADRKEFQSSLFAAAVAFVLACLSFSAAAHAADVNVSTPSDNANVRAPFAVQAASATCLGQSVSAMGYSIDDSSHTAVSNFTFINALALASSGEHTLHVKAWGSRGASCASDIHIHVQDGNSIPPAVTVVSNLQRLTNWTGNRDSATEGLAAGATSLAGLPSMSGQARQYVANLGANGGEIFHVFFGSDVAATNFVYDTQIMLSTTNGLANIEMDMNQVMANGQTVIYGVQCDGYAHTWDYTVNTGTPQHPIDTWRHSNVACNPQSWTPGVWHHVQIAYSRDAVGTVTYHSVSLDGMESDFLGATGNSAFALGWAPTLLTNLQIDARSPTTINVLLDNLTVYRW